MAWDVTGANTNSPQIGGWGIDPGGGTWGNPMSGNVLMFESRYLTPLLGVKGDYIEYTQNPPLDPGTFFVPGTVPGMGNAYTSPPNPLTVWEFSYDCYFEDTKAAIGNFIVSFTVINQSGYVLKFTDKFTNTLVNALYSHTPDPYQATTINPNSNPPETHSRGRRVMTSSFDGTQELDVTLWGKMIVKIEDIFGGLSAQDDLIWEVDNLSLKKQTYSVSSTTATTLNGWDVWDNWNVIGTTQGQYKLRHNPGTSATLSQPVAAVTGPPSTSGGLIAGQQYEISMDLEYHIGSGNTNSSKVYIPNLPAQVPATIGSVGGGLLGVSGFNVYLTPNSQGVATATWVQAQDQTDLVIKQNASGGADIDNVTLKRLVPYGGTVTGWNLLGSQENIYWEPNQPGGTTHGSVKFDSANTGEKLIQDITNLNLKSGDVIRVSFRLFDFEAGEIAIHIYGGSQGNAGVTFGGITTDGFYQFTGTIGDNNLNTTVSNAVTGLGSAANFMNNIAITTWGSVSNNVMNIVNTTVSIDDINLELLVSGDTITFNEKVRGWVSFKSFVAEQGISMGNNYYTILNGILWKHHVEEDSSGQEVWRNTFYDLGDGPIYTPSSVDIVLNSTIDTVKSFNTLDYIGSQSKIEELKTYGASGAIGTPTGTELIVHDAGTGNIDYKLNGVTGGTSGIGAIIITPPTLNEIEVIGMSNMQVNFSTPNLPTTVDTISFGGGAILEAQKQYVLEFDYKVSNSSVFVAISDAAPIPTQMDPTPIFNSGTIAYEEISGSGSLSLVFEAYGSTSPRIYIFHTVNATGITDAITSVKLENISFKELDFVVTRNEDQFYNLTAKDGWYVDKVTTDIQEGSIDEFIKKEGKWFNFIRGVDTFGNNTMIFDHVEDFGELNIQGIGVPSAVTREFQPEKTILTFTSGNTNSSLQIGDTIYFNRMALGTIAGFDEIDPYYLLKYGVVDTISDDGKVIVVDPFDQGPTSWAPIATESFCMFVKNQVVNKSGLTGSFMNVNLKNDSHEHAEIFSVASEVTSNSN